MGRYYNGDISGKFGFATQPSNDGEFFGAVESDSSVIPYVIYSEDVPEAIEKTRTLIRSFNKRTGKKMTIDTPEEKFWDMVDQKWYQNTDNGLLACRISMGLQIYEFAKENPDTSIYFDAEV